MLKGGAEPGLSSDHLFLSKSVTVSEPRFLHQQDKDRPIVLVSGFGVLGMMHRKKEPRAWNVVGA